MYLEHFGLRESPFSLTPDTSYFFAHEGAQAALNTLLVSLRSGEGFVKIVAEVGCGKTLMCRRLIAALSEECETAYIPNPNLDARTMLLAVCDELAIQIDPNASSHSVIKTLRQCLLEHAKAGRRVVLIIDEAQSIPDETIESLRLMSNIETEKQKLLQIVMFGQPELDEKLSRPHLRQLLQRITFADYISPMAPGDVGAYLVHRLVTAGAADGRRFSDAAVETLAKRSGGIPRLVNVIAHKSLMLAYGEGGQLVEKHHVDLAADDTAAAENVTAATPWLARLKSLATAVRGTGSR